MLQSRERVARCDIGYTCLFLRKTSILGKCSGQELPHERDCLAGCPDGRRVHVKP